MAALVVVAQGLALAPVAIAVPAATPPPLPDPAQVEITSTGFVPSSIDAVAGQSVVFTNDSGAVRKVQATSGIFDSGAIPDGGAFTVAIPDDRTIPFTSNGSPTFVGSLQVGPNGFSGPADDPISAHLPTEVAPAEDPASFGMEPTWGLTVSRTTLMVLFSASATVTDANDLLGAVHGRVTGRVAGSDAVVVAIADAGVGDFADLMAALAVLQASPAVTAAAFDPIGNDANTHPVRPEASAAGFQLKSFPYVDGDTKIGAFGIEQARFPQAWNLFDAMKRYGQKVDVGIADSGFDLGHVEFADVPGQGKHVDYVASCAEAKCQNATTEAGQEHGTAVAAQLGGVSVGADPLAHLVVTRQASMKATDGPGATSFLQKTVSIQTLLDQKHTGLAPNLRVLSLSFGWVGFGRVGGVDSNPLVWETTFAGKHCGPGDGDDKPTATEGCTPNNEDGFRTQMAALGKIAVDLSQKAKAQDVLIVEAAHNYSDISNAVNFCLPLGQTPCTPERIRGDAVQVFAWAARHGGADNVLVVGAVDKDAKRSPYSNVNTDVSAAGSDGTEGSGTISAAPGGTAYAEFNGTSGATPYVAALAAMVSQYAPYLQPSQVRSLIIAHANPHVDDGASPLIDAYATLTALTGGLVDATDVNDPSVDGNRRVILPKDGSGQAPVDDVQTGVVVDGRELHTAGDGAIDMKDFRRYRDAFLQTCSGVSHCPPTRDAVHLDGDPDNVKKDLNFDDCSVGCETNEDLFPRFDPAGTGGLAPALLGTVGTDAGGDPANGNGSLTGIGVYEALWGKQRSGGVTPDTEGWSKDDLEALLDSGDLEVHTAPLFALGAAEVRITPEQSTDGGTTWTAAGKARTVTAAQLDPEQVAVVTVLVAPTTSGTRVRVGLSATIGGKTVRTTRPQGVLHLGEDVRVDPKVIRGVVALEPKVPVTGRTAELTLTLTADGLTIGGQPASGDATPNDATPNDATPNDAPPVSDGFDDGTDDLMGAPVDFTVDGTGDDPADPDVKSADATTDDSGEAKATIDGGGKAGDAEITAEAKIDGDPVTVVLPTKVANPTKLVYTWEQKVTDWHRLTHGLQSPPDPTDFSTYDTTETPGNLPVTLTRVGSVDLDAATPTFTETVGDNTLSIHASSSYGASDETDTLPPQLRTLTDRPLSRVKVDKGDDAFTISGLRQLTDVGYPLGCTQPTPDTCPPRFWSIYGYLALSPRRDTSTFAANGLYTGYQGGDGTAFQHAIDPDADLIVRSDGQGGWVPTTFCGSGEFTFHPDVYGPIAEVSGGGHYETRFTATIVNGDGTSTPLTLPNCTDPAPPAARFTFDPDPTHLGTPTTFSDKSVAQAGIQSYLWDFGDHTTSTDASPDHLYGNDGTYAVKLTITDGKGRTDTVTHQVTVNPNPPNGSIDDQTASVGDHVILHGRISSPSEFDRRALQVGISSPAIGFPLQATRLLPAGVIDVDLGTLPVGTYPITMTVTDLEHQTSTATATVIVIDGTADDPTDPGPVTEPPVSGCTSGPEVPGEVDDLIQQLSALREQINRLEVIASPTLMAAAKRHATDLSTHPGLTDVGSDGSTVTSRAADAGYFPDAAVDELVLRGPKSAADALTTWQNMTQQGAKLVDRKWNAVGAYRVPAGTGWVWVLVVGEDIDCPAPASPTGPLAKTDAMPTEAAARPEVAMASSLSAAPHPADHPLSPPASGPASPPAGATRQPAKRSASVEAATPSTTTSGSTAKPPKAKPSTGSTTRRTTTTFALAHSTGRLGVGTQHGRLAQPRGPPVSVASTPTSAADRDEVSPHVVDPTLPEVAVPAFTVDDATPTTGATVLVHNRTRFQAFPVPGTFTPGDGRPGRLIDPDTTIATSWYSAAGLDPSIAAKADDGGFTATTHLAVVGTTVAPTIAYTGPATGAQGAKVIVTAKVGTVGTGQPMAGRPVRFTVGTSSVVAVSQADGTVVTPLVLAGDEALGDTQISVQALAVGASPAASTSAAFKVFGNEVPIADAGGPYDAVLGANVLLNGSGSSDPDSSNGLTYAWTVGADDLPLSTATNPLLESDSIDDQHLCGGSCDPDVAYPVTLTVTDDLGGVATDHTTITFHRDFNLTITPQQTTLNPGGSTSYQVGAITTSGFSDPIHLELGGLPTGVTAQLPATIDPGSVVLLTVTAAQDVTAEHASIVITGTADGLTRQVGGAIDLEFGLIPRCTASLDGKVTDRETGLPVEGAQVTNDGGGATTTGADGTYHLEGLAVGATNQPVSQETDFSKPGYYLDKRNVTLACNLTSHADGLLLKQQKATLTGTITEGTRDDTNPSGPVVSTGVPVPGAEVLGFADPVSSDAAGHYEGGGIGLGDANSPGSTSITVHKDGYWEYRRLSVPVTAAGPNVADVVLVKACYGDAYVRVIDDSTGQVVPGLRVVTSAVAPIGFTGPIQGTTDTDGIAHLDHLPLGFENGPLMNALVSVDTTGTNYEQSAFPSLYLPSCGSTGLAVVHVHGPLPTYTAGLKVTVVDDDTNAPIPGADVQVGGGGLTPTDADGMVEYPDISLQVPGQKTGSTTVTALPTGYYSEFKSVTLTADQTAEVTLRLKQQKSATVTGTVTDAATGAPLANIEIGINLASNDVIKTDADGHYSWTAPFLNRYNAPTAINAVALATPEYWGSEAPVYLTATAEGPNVADFALRRRCTPGTIHGIVLNADTHEPIQAATVRTQVGDPVLTDATGHFVLTNQEYKFDKPGPIDVFAGKTGFISATKTVTLFCGADIELNFGTSTATTTIKGTVTSKATGNPVSGAFLGSGFGGSTTTADDGTYTLTGVPLSDSGGSRTWSVAVIPSTDSGLLRGDKTATVSSNGPTTLDFQLEKPVVNAPIDAKDDSFTVDASVTTTVANASGVLGNDVGQGLSATLLTAPAHGTLTLGSGGGFTYVPPGNRVGDETFSYTATDATGQTDTATVTLHVTGPPPPVAHDDTITLDQGTGVLVQDPAAGLMANDTGDAKVVSHTDPITGRIVIFDDGGYSFIPYDAYYGTFTIQYTIEDAFGQQSTATVTIVVVPTTIPPAPVLTDDTGNTPYGTPLTVAAPGVLANDTGPSLQVTASTQPLHGSVSIAADGSYTYTPGDDFSGADSFTYTITDQISRHATATVRITVGARPDAGLAITIGARDSGGTGTFAAIARAPWGTAFASHVVVTNTGTAPLAGVAVTDPDGIGCARSIGNLVGGATSEYDCTGTTTPTKDAVAHVHVTGSIAVTPTVAHAGGTEPLAVAAPDASADGAVTFQLTYSIGDRVWEDEEHDGLQDRTDPSLEDVPVALLDGTTGAPVATTTTDDEGTYRFRDLRPGTYRVRFARLDGYRWTIEGAGGDGTIDSDAVFDTTTSATARTDLVTITDGQAPQGHANPLALTIADLDAGLWRPASISGTAFADTDHDGTLDAGEATIALVAVDLLDAEGNVVTRTTTGSDGTYRFEDLTPGTYRIRWTVPAGYGLPTGTNVVAHAQGSSGEATAVTGTSGAIEVAVGQAVAGANIGLWPEATTTTTTTAPTTTSTTTTTTTPTTSTTTSTTSTTTSTTTSSTTVPGSTTTTSSTTTSTTGGAGVLPGGATPSGPSAPPVSAGPLPRTGQDVAGMVLLGLALAATGAITLITRRRRLLLRR